MQGELNDTRVSRDNAPFFIPPTMSSVPPTPTTNGSSPIERTPGFIPLVSVVDFHHARGPEVERWFGVDEGRDPAVEYDWTLLPFMALSDGAHA